MPPPKSLKRFIEWFGALRKKPTKKKIRDSFLNFLEREDFLPIWLDSLRDSHSKKPLKSDGEVSSEKMRRAETLKKLLPTHKDKLIELLRLSFDQTEQLESLKDLNPIKS